MNQRAQNRPPTDTNDDNGWAAAVSRAFVPSPQDRFEPFPLTDAQQAYWLGRSSSFELGGVTGHFYYEIESPTLDLDRVTRAWRKLVERHDIFRVVLLPHGMQRVLEKVEPYKIATVDLRARPAAQAEAVLAELRDELSNQSLDPEHWPLFDIRAAILPDRVRLLLAIDGLLLDGMSLQTILNEFAQLYDDGRALPEQTVSFRDYVLAEQRLRSTPAWRDAFAYWNDLIPTLPPAPDLPVVRGQAQGARALFTRRSGALDPGQWAAFKRRVARAGLTPSGVLLAAYAESVAAWSASPRFTLNVAFSNRLPIDPGVDRIAGMIATSMLFDVDGQRRDSFRERARRLQKRLWQHLPRAHVGGIEVLRSLSRAAGQTVTMPVAFTSVLNQRDDAPSIGDLTSRLGNVGTVVYKMSQSPQVLIDLHVLELGGGLGFNFDTAENRFLPGVCDAMFAAFERLVVRMATDEHVWEERAPEMRPSDQIALESAINDTARPVPDGALTTAILAEAERRPDAIALIADGQRLTYAEVVRRARCLTGYLLAAGAKPGSIIGIALEKGWEQVVAALGVLEAKMAYLPIDPSSPPERLEQVLTNARVETVLTGSLLATTVEWPSGLSILVVEDACAEGTPGPTGVVDPEALAMVILTSGSTGTPRGVMLNHRAPLNTTTDLNRRFGVTSEDRLLSLTPMQHDMAAYDLFGILGAGGTLVMPRPDLVRDPAHWLSRMHSERVTVWNSVPAMMQMLLDYVEKKSERLPSSLRLVMLGGDFIPLDFPRRLAAQVPSARLVSLGGPTETSVVSICHPVDTIDPEWTSIPYGRPLANQRVYIFDEELDSRPVWVPGEIWSGGLGVARGYIHNEEETKASFVTHPRTGERLYRTGDLGLIRPDGNLEILGRVDYQVKINGVRIEPAEIASTLRKHPHVKDALVVAHGERGAHRTLVAYVVVDEAAPQDAELRGFLAARLVRAMIPSAFVRLNAFPLNANGKIDRQALPPPTRGAAVESPEAISLTPRQREIQEAIASVLDIGVASVSPDQNFMNLGGDSLRAVLVQSKLREKFGVEVPIGKFFEPLTLTVIDQAIAEAAGEAPRSSIERRVSPHVWPLSYAQSRLLFLEQIAPGAPIFNIAIHIRLRGRLDVAALESALREIKRRHETLRATFALVDGKPSQTITPDAPVKLEIRDLSGLAEVEATRRFAELAAAEARRPFDLATGPLLRELFVRFGPEHHALVVTMHHICTDAWSFGVILRELQALYGAFAKAAPSPLAEPELQYADYAAWELRREDDGDERERARAWRERLAGAPPFISLPTVREPPASPSYDGALAPVTVAEGALKNVLAAMCQAEGATPFMVLLAAYAVLMGAWSGERDVVIGTPLAGRKHVETERLVGCFVNMLPLRVDLSRPRSFRELVHSVKEGVLGDFEHEIAFDQLVRAVNPRRSPSRTPIFQVVLQLDTMEIPPLEWDGLRGEFLPLDTGTARYDFAVRFVETDGGYSGHVNYRRDLWDADTIARVAETFARLTARALNDPEVSLAALDAEAKASLAVEPDFRVR